MLCSSSAISHSPTPNSSISRSASTASSTRGPVPPSLARAAWETRRSPTSHASRIIDWPVPEGRLLLRDLIEHATQPQFVYRHAWRVGDFLIWDNRATMHRARPFDDTKHRRELRRVTTLDLAEPAAPIPPKA